jgi:large repetitive protein
MLRYMLLMVLAVGCRQGGTGKPDENPNVDSSNLDGRDADGDGFAVDEGDCDDEDPKVNPGVTEVCDGLDEDCDGVADDGLERTWYQDADADGYGDPATATTVCAAPDGYIAEATDCDDLDATIHPGAEESCTDPQDRNCDGLVGFVDTDGDGYPACEDCNDADASVSPGAVEICDTVDRDEDCDGLSDDADPSVDSSGLQRTFTDADGDGYGADGTELFACDGTGVTLGGDCDDGNPSYNPGIAEVDCTDPNDYNCDGSVGFADVDADGFAACEECDDSNSAVFPNAAEVCNGLDDNCDGQVDESGGSSTWFADGDGDGFGDDSTAIVACSAPPGYVSIGGDCDDRAAGTWPGAGEYCDGVDTDCDGVLDNDALDAGLWYADLDADSFGDGSTSTSACNQPTGYAGDNTDCDDSNAAVNPSATELCNGQDDDCDGTIDEADAADVRLWYTDTDGDGFGADGAGTLSCSAPAGMVALAGDCDDQNAAYNPAASESDCTDPNDYNCDGQTGYANADGDTFAACQDCDDSNVAIFPGATEVCNGVDDNCDGSIDEPGASGEQTWYADVDADGFGDGNAPLTACTQPAGSSTSSTDCDDRRSATNPAAPEYCNGSDDDCDGSTDEADALDASTWYTDSDGDGWGDAAVATVSCTAPAGSVADPGDCDDNNAAAMPGNTELCNGFDDNCDGVVDDDATDRQAWYGDRDGDGYGDVAASVLSCQAPPGYVADNADCDDGNASANPGATEACNGYDDDCDGRVDEPGATGETSWYADADGDGYGDRTQRATACTAPVGYVSDSRDCDDQNAGISPSAAEVCDGVDQDCSGVADNGVLGTGSACAADSCEAILYDNVNAASGTYYLDPSGTVFQTTCDMSSDGGGWTLIGSVVNPDGRSWNSYAAFTDSSTFGTLATWTTADYKNPGWSSVVADDFLVRTDEYAVGWTGIMNEESFTSWASRNYNTAACSTTFLGGTPDYTEGISVQQSLLFDVVLRAQDTNAACFPTTNENAFLTFTLSECCWTNGLGNTPGGQATWRTHDLSMLKLQKLQAVACTPGTWPCNPAGWQHNYYSGAQANCYDTSCKSVYAAVWVR